VAGVTILSRIAGLARDAVCSRIFGAGPVWSAFAFAFVIPNLFRRLFGEGALSAAFIPAYARLRGEDPALADRFATATALLLTAGLAGLTLLGEIALLMVLRLAPLDESGALAIRLTMVMLPFMPLVCLTALLGGMLQTHGRFAPTAAAPILLNVAMIGGALLGALVMRASLEITAVLVAIGVVIAGGAQVAWSLAALRGRSMWTRAFSGASGPLRTMGRRMGPSIVALGALQVNTLLDALIASWPILVGSTIALPFLGVREYPLDEASNAVLFFTQRLYQFPLGVFGVALATAVFPALARAAGDSRLFGATLRRGVRLALFIGIPASVGLIAVRTDLARVILGGGLFEASDVERVSFTLLGYAPGVWAYATTQVYARAFFARGDTVTPMRVALATVGANLALNLILIWPLGEAGLAWSTSITAAGQCLALAVLAPRGEGSQRDDLWRSAGWSAGLSGMMAVALAALGALWAGGVDPSWGESLVRLAAFVGAGAVVFLGGAALARRPETGWLLERDASPDGAKSVREREGTNEAGPTGR
jgi:putative peptidoglycan lipid II flippase